MSSSFDHEWSDGVRVLSNGSISLETCEELVSGEMATRFQIIGYLAEMLRRTHGNEIISAIKEAHFETGKVAGANVAKALGKNDLSTIIDLFTDTSGVDLFKPEIIERTQDRVAIHWRSCPVPALLKTFKEWDFPNDFLQFLCPIIESFENGFIEGFNPELTIMTPPEVGETGLNKNGSFCTVIISNKD